MTRSELWILSEWQVACERQALFGEDLISHRLRTPFAEVDLLCAGQRRSRAPSARAGRMTLLEVKSSSQDLDIFPVVKSRQIRRLFAARMYLQEKHETEVELLLAVVSHRGGSSLNPRIRYFAGECLLT